MTFLSALWCALRGDVPSRGEFTEHERRISELESKTNDLERRAEIKRALRSLVGEEK